MPYVSTVLLIFVLAVLSACATAQLPVIEKLDEVTAVTITSSRTPFIMSPETLYARSAERDYLQLGAIEINRTGALNYFVWLGISDMSQISSVDRRPEGYESIVLEADGDEMRLALLGWSAAAIGASEPVYKKFFATSVDAYYQVTLDQIQQLARAEVLKLRTTSAESKEFVPWYKQATSKSELMEFVSVVSQ